MSNFSIYQHRGILAALAVGILFISSNQVGAAGFALHEQSVTYLGNAFSGTASSSTDASTGFYNPAGLEELKTNQLVLGLTYLKAQTKLYNATATNNAGAAVAGSSEAKPKSGAVVPGLHLAFRANNKFVVGFSIAAPFGLSTKYSGTDIARYIAVESKVETVDVTPSISYKINDNFSIGAAFDAMYFKATLSSNTNFGGAEGFLKNHADGWSYGYHVGFLYKPSEVTKVGLAYFSRFTPRLSGSVESANLPLAPISSLTSSINLPDRIVYSVTHKYNDVWSAMADVEWDHWSRLKRLDINYNTGASVTELLYYKNAFRFAFGSDYQCNKKLTIKGGISYEQTPINNTYLSARLPDADRYSLAVGLKYIVNKCISLDAAYSHVFAESAAVALGSAQTGGAQTLFGDYRSSADLVGIQLTWNFV